MPPTGTVYVTQQPRPNKRNWTPNLSTASKFGKIVFIFEGQDRPYCDTYGAMLRVVEALKDFDPERDYLLWPQAGDPASAVSTFLMMGMIMATWGFRQVKTLYWERKLKDGERSSTEGYYVPIIYPAIEVPEPSSVRKH